MSKWVTFYEDIFNGISDLKIHENKETATDYFKKHYRIYFQMSTKINVKLPMSYGYAHRKFKGMSKPMFEKIYGKISEDLFLKKGG